jgi:hypothetical protein
LVAGQLNPQPMEVMARNISPAGVMRARAIGNLESCISWGPAKESKEESKEHSEAAYLAAIRPDGHHLPDMPASRLPYPHVSPENSMAG